MVRLYGMNVIPNKALDMYGRTILSVIRLYGMNVIPNKVLDMCASLHLTICYLLKDEHERLRVYID